MSTPNATTTGTPVLPTAVTMAATSSVVSTTTLRTEGLTRSTIARRCKPGGPWRRLFPGVVLLADREPTREQLLHGARCRMGAHAVVTGTDALCAHGITTHTATVVRLLVPAAQRAASSELVAPERTARLPAPVWRRGLPFAPPARATVDAARHEPDRRLLRVLLRAPLYFGACTVTQLWSEVERGNQRGTAAVREELRSLGDADHVTDFGTALLMLRSGSMPQPHWHVALTDQHGRELGAVDAWWDHLAVGWRFHTPPRADRTTNDAELTSAGVVLVHTDAARLHQDPAGVRTDIAAAMRQAAQRPRPTVGWRANAPRTRPT